MKKIAKENIFGAFEGAGYSANGLYRPAIDCRMFSLSLIPYDPVILKRKGKYENPHVSS